MSVSICKVLPSCISVEEAEGRAILVGLQALADLYRGPIILETDCQVIAKDLAAGWQSRSGCYGLLVDIKNAMAGFQSCTISSIRRNANALAHGLAAEARRSGDRQMLADVPDSHRSLVISECTSPSE